VGEFQIGSLEVKIGLLILSHAVDLFTGIKRFKTDSDFIVPTDDGPEFPGLQFQGTVGPVLYVPAAAEVFVEEQLSPAVIYLYLAYIRDSRLYSAVPYGSAVLPDGDFNRAGFLGKQGPIIGVPRVKPGNFRAAPAGHFRRFCGTDAETVFTPAFYPEFFRVVTVNEPVLFFGKK
jgi:hypothetical protein